MAVSFELSINKRYKTNLIQEYLFPGLIEGKPLTDRAANKILKKALDKIDCRIKISFHNLRHSYATHLHESGNSFKRHSGITGAYFEQDNGEIHKSIYSPFIQIEESFR